MYFLPTPLGCAWFRCWPMVYTDSGATWDSGTVSNQTESHLWNWLVTVPYGQLGQWNSLRITWIAARVECGPLNADHVDCGPCRIRTIYFIIVFCFLCKKHWYFHVFLKVITLYENEVDKYVHKAKMHEMSKYNTGCLFHTCNGYFNVFYVKNIDNFMFSYVFMFSMKAKSINKCALKKL